MSGETTLVKAKYSEAADEVKAFPAEVSAPGAKSFDKFLEEHTLTVKKYVGSATLKSGELAKEDKAGESFTLPLAATANQIIGVACGAVASVKVTTSGGAVIIGDFLSGVATITLTEFQHIILQSEGTNWLIIAGEPKPEQKYGAQVSYTKAEAEAGVEPSATRRAFLIFNEVPAGLEIGGVKIEPSVQAVYIVNPGQKWKGTTTAKTQTLLL